MLFFINFIQLIFNMLILTALHIFVDESSDACTHPQILESKQLSEILIAFRRMINKLHTVSSIAIKQCITTRKVVITAVYRRGDGNVQNGPKADSPTADMTLHSYGEHFRVSRTVPDFKLCDVFGS